MSFKCLLSNTSTLLVPFDDNGKPQNSKEPNQSIPKVALDVLATVNENQKGCFLCV